MTATYTRPNFTTQAPAAYKANIEAMAQVFERLGNAFAPHAQDQGSPAPDMAVRIEAGHVFYDGALSEIAAQTVSGFAVPSAGQHRVDRVVLDPMTGACTRVAGTAASGSPSAVAPAIPPGKSPVCQVLITSADTTITDSMITDERSFFGTAS